MIPARPTPWCRLRCSGALGIKSARSKTFILADGSEIKRPLGEATFRLNEEEGTSPVIFGEKGDAALLGTVSLEVLGLIQDPLKRNLRVLPMVLTAQQAVDNQC